MTDGYIGNDMAILGEVQNHPNARVFAFGIGSSVNRFLLDKMAEHGRGEVEYVGLQDDGSTAARRFHERVQHPLLTDISVDWDDLDVSEIYPKQLPDLFSAKPLVLTGRYTTPGKATIRLRGKVAGRSVVRKIEVEFPGFEPNNDVLATLWARTKIADLMAQDYRGIQQGTPKPKVQEAITQLGLDYRLMTQFTSFVAVEELMITEGGQPRRIEVPVEMPKGVSYEGVFGENIQLSFSSRMGTMKPAAQMSQSLLGGMVAADASVAPMFERRVETDFMRRPKESQSKLDSTLLGMLKKKEKRESFSAEESAKIQNGKIMVQVWLTNTKAEALSQLKKFGFKLVIQPKSGQLVIGYISIEQLEALAKLSNVQYVMLQPVPA
jgi:Ca-activated chloride channel family protein